MNRLLFFGALLGLAACSQVPSPAADAAFSLSPQALGTAASDSGSQLAYSSSGALYVAGYTRGSLDLPNRGGNDIFLRRYRPDKTVVWKRQIASSADDVVKDLAADGGNQLYVAGLQGSTCFHSKYSASGTLLWKRLYTDFCSAMAMAVDKVGNVYLTEDTSENGWAKYELRKYNSSGAQVYAATISSNNGLGSSGVGAVAVDDSGYAYVYAGEYDDDAWNYIDKVSPTGAVVDGFLYKTWACCNTSVHDLEVIGNAIYAVGSKDYYAYPTSENPDFTFIDADIYVVKYNLDGSLGWRRTFGTRAVDRGTAITADPSGNVYAVGVTRGSLAAPNAGYDDVVMRKYSAAGTTQWTKQLGNASFDVASDAVATAPRSAALYLTGATGGALEGGTYRGATDAFLLRRDGLGNKVWTDQ